MCVVMFIVISETNKKVEYVLLAVLSYIDKIY